ncbi:MAG: hypothetical protein NG784_14785 [Candidatus Jettenia sp.]|nr:hypothetical protein [Candidatus Jettenia sp.]
MEKLCVGIRRNPIYKRRERQCLIYPCSLSLKEYAGYRQDLIIGGKTTVDDVKNGDLQKNW